MRKILISLLLVTLSMLIISKPFVRTHKDVTLLEAKSMIDSGDQLIIVDVRDVHEFCDTHGHIPDALNYPWNSGILRSKYEELPKDNPILVVCRLDHRSNKAANFLDSKGYLYVYDMLGGMTAWQWDTTHEICDNRLNFVKK